MKIGIGGYGFVGKATEQLKNDKIDLVIYDKNPDLCNPSETSVEDISKCDFSIYFCTNTNETRWELLY